MSFPVRGIDYAWGRPPYDEFKRQGYCFAMRYVSHDASKDLTLREKTELWRRGIAVGLVFESTANRALSGSAGGTADAMFARARANSLGLSNIPIYFGVDFDATDAQKPVIARYLKGAANVLGHERVGVYGGYWVVKYLAERDACHWFWQTYAWSGGRVYSLLSRLVPMLRRVHPSAHIYQWKNGVRIGGLSCDLNKAQAGEIGVRGPHVPAPPPKPKPKPPPPPPKPDARYHLKLRDENGHEYVWDNLPEPGRTLHEFNLVEHKITEGWIKRTTP